MERYEMQRIHHFQLLRFFLRGIFLCKITLLLLLLSVGLLQRMKALHKNCFNLNLSLFAM